MKGYHNFMLKKSFHSDSYQNRAPIQEAEKGPEAKRERSDESLAQDEQSKPQQGGSRFDKARVYADLTSVLTASHSSRHSKHKGHDTTTTTSSSSAAQLMLEQLPRFCSPTICGTLSQPTTSTERTPDTFDWSLEQRAILSPVNITTDTDGNGDWAHIIEFNTALRKKESELFFSQRTIAPSPFITNRPLLDVAEEAEEAEGHAASQPPPVDRRSFRDMSRDDFTIDDTHKQQHNNHRDDDDDDCQANESDHDEDDEDKYYKINLESCLKDTDDEDEDEEERRNDDDDDDLMEEDDDDDKLELMFSPQPLRSSQTQQRMEVFSPDTFSRVMDDEHTLQSTPKTTTGSQRNARIRTRGVRGSPYNMGPYQN